VVRYEFRNKGIDVLLMHSRGLNKDPDIEVQIVAFITVPGNQSGVSKKLVERLNNTDYSVRLKADTYSWAL
jgi:hypothetical protein